MINLREVCKQLSLDLQLDEPITEDPAGIFNVFIDVDFTIQIEFMEGGLSFFCILANCPKENVELFLTELMDANLYGQATRNCILGLTAEGDQLTLSQFNDGDLDYKSFGDRLQDFYNVALFWREQAMSPMKI